MKKEIIKTIGKDSERIGSTTVTGEGAQVKYTVDVPETVAVRDYVSGKGYSGIVHWDGENPTVAGVKVTPTEIKDGISYANKSEVDSILADFEEHKGIKDPQKARDDKYKAAEDKAFSRVAEREPFSFTPETDVVYQAYQKQYTRQAEEAMRQILNMNNTSLSGASGAVLSEAMAARDKELNKITDAIPELYEDAFNRYIKENELAGSDFKLINNAANDYYDRVHKFNVETKKEIAEAGEAEREERQRLIENEQKAENDAYDNALKAIEASYLDEKMVTDINKSKASAENTAMDNAIARGFFVEGDEVNLPWLSQYRTSDGGYSISPTVAKVAYEYQAANARERGKINAKLGLR